MRIYKVVTEGGGKNSVFITLRAAQNKVENHKIGKLFIQPEELDGVILKTPIFERYFVFYGRYDDFTYLHGAFDTLEATMKSVEDCTEDYAEVYDINGKQIY